MEYPKLINYSTENIFFENKNLKLRVLSNDDLLSDFTNFIDLYVLDIFKPRIRVE